MGVILCSSVLASMNDITVHTSVFTPKMLSDTSGVEHLVAHDHLNALPCMVNCLSRNATYPFVAHVFSVFQYRAWVKYSIEHPPEMLS